MDMLTRLLRLVRHLSERVYVALLVVLLALVYGMFLPIFAVGWRLRGARRGGWHARDDRELTSVERLRTLF